MTIQICGNCDGVMEANLFHNCIRGLTDNINRIHSTIDKKRLDNLDGLKHALKIIDEVEQYYQSSGIFYENNYNPFLDIKNKIRMLLGLQLIKRD